jgi:hypothetical protein
LKPNRPLSYPELDHSRIDVLKFKNADKSVYELTGGLEEIVRNYIETDALSDLQFKNRPSGKPKTVT